jgi:hypothetical protein
MDAVTASLERNAYLLVAEEQAGFDEVGAGCAHGEVEALGGPGGAQG